MLPWTPFVLCLSSHLRNYFYVSVLFLPAVFLDSALQLVLLNSLSVTGTLIVVFPDILCSFHFFTKLHLGNLLALSDNLRNNLVSISVIYLRLWITLVKMCVFLFFLDEFSCLACTSLFCHAPPTTRTQKSDIQPFPTAGSCWEGPPVCVGTVRSHLGQGRKRDTAEAANSLPPRLCGLQHILSKVVTSVPPHCVFLFKNQVSWVPSKALRSGVVLSWVTCYLLPFPRSIMSHGFPGEKAALRTVEIACPQGMG